MTSRSGNRLLSRAASNDATRRHTIVLDLQFDEHHSERQRKSCAAQLSQSYAARGRAIAANSTSTTESTTPTINESSANANTNETELPPSKRVKKQQSVQKVEEKINDATIDINDANSITNSNSNSITNSNSNSNSNSITNSNSNSELSSNINDVSFDLAITSWNDLYRLSLPDVDRWRRCSLHTQRVDAVFPCERLVYLTADSSHVLHELCDDDIYVIGALVDRNQLPGVTAKFAEAHGIRTAKLPLDAPELGIKLASGAPLAFAHVVDIVCRVRANGGDWAKAIRNALPPRKLQNNSEAALAEQAAKAKAKEERQEASRRVKTERTEQLVALLKRAREETNAEIPDEIIKRVASEAASRRGVNHKLRLDQATIVHYAKSHEALLKVVEKAQQLDDLN